MSDLTPDGKWLDEMLTEWIGQITNIKLLTKWEKDIRLRVARLREQFAYSFKELDAVYSTMRKGTRLYSVKGFEMKGRRYKRAYFYAYQPRAQRLWITIRQRMKKGDKRYYMEGAGLIQSYQWSPVELKIRERTHARKQTEE